MLRAPAVALAGANSVWGYRLGALVCLLAVIALGGLSRSAPARPTALSPRSCSIVNPVAIDALRLGHPEERLGSALCVIALLLARERRLIGAGVALGAALATKQWALIAIAPVLLATPREGRMRVALTAGGVARRRSSARWRWPTRTPSSRHAPPGLRRGGDADRQSMGLGGADGHISLGGTDTATTYVVPGWLQHGAHPFVALLTLGLGAAALRSRRSIDPLALLAALMLVRCALDPWNHAYYHAPFLAALIAWEVLEARRAPWLSAARGGLPRIVFGLHCRFRTRSTRCGRRRCSLAQPACPALGAAAGAPASPLAAA